MLRFGKTKVAKKILLYKRNWDLNVVKMVVSKLVETRNNSIFMIGYLDEVIKPLILSIS